MQCNHSFNHFDPGGNEKSSRDGRGAGERLGAGRNTMDKHRLILVSNNIHSFLESCFVFKITSYRLATLYYFLIVQCIHVFIAVPASLFVHQ